MDRVFASNSEFEVGWADLMCRGSVGGEREGEQEEGGENGEISASRRNDRLESCKP